METGVGCVSVYQSTQCVLGSDATKSMCIFLSTALRKPPKWTTHHHQRLPLLTVFVIIVTSVTVVLLAVQLVVCSGLGGSRP